MTRTFELEEVSYGSDWPSGDPPMNALVTGSGLRVWVRPLDEGRNAPSTGTVPQRKCTKGANEMKFL